MRRVATSALIFALSLTGAPVFAAGPSRAARQGQTTGTITGTAQDSQGRTLSNCTVRIRNLANGNLAGSTPCGAAGEFSFVGLNPGNYAIEIVDAAGNIVGTSASIAVVAGTTAAVTVTASAAAALGAASGAAAAGATAGGAAAAAAGGISTAAIVGAAAAAAGIVGVIVAVNRSNASPSR
jgi:Carboxypeptidase regulatory-like domain